MNYTIDNIGMKIINKNFGRNEEGTNKSQNKLRSALILELDMVTNNFIEAFDNLKVAIVKSDESDIWYSLSMLIYTREHILELLDQIKKLIENSQDNIEVSGLEMLLGDYSEINKNKLRKNLGRGLREWFENTEKDPILENNVFERSSIPNLDVKQMIRHFDPETYELTFFENTYDLKKFHDVVKDIKRNIDEIYRENYLAF